MKLFSWVLFFMFLSSNSSGQIDSLFWSNRAVKQIRTYSEVDHYHSFAFHPNGKLHFEAQIQLYTSLESKVEMMQSFDWNGTQTLKQGTGRHTVYFENGGISEEFQYENNDLIGEYTAYYSNGIIKVKGSYDEMSRKIKNHKQGIWRYFDQNGKCYEERKCVNGHSYYWNYWEKGKQILKEGNGKVKEFFDNGTLKAAGKVKEGKRFGQWIEYYRDGSIANSLNYGHWPKNQINEGAFKLEINETFDSKGSRIGEKGSGYRTTFRTDGTVSIKEHYTSNFLDTLITYYDNGQVYSKVNVGNYYYILVESYYSSGSLAFKLGSYWYEDGNLKRVHTVIEEADGAIQYVHRIEYYPNGQKKEESNCTYTFILNESLEGIYDPKCVSVYWDEFGNEVNHPK